MVLSSPTSDLRRLVHVLGPYRGPTASGWYQWNHKACGDTKHRLGVKGALWTCFRCGSRGDLKDLVPGLVRLPRMPGQRGTPAAVSAPAPSRLPWRPIRLDGAPSVLETRVVAYLERRGVPRARAALLGLGYGVLPPYQGSVIAPWTRDDGSLGGWQARKVYDPPEGVPKIRHVRPEEFPLYTPAQGAMLHYDLLAQGSDVLLVEGPFDTWSGLRVMPTVGLMGSDIYPAQIRRLQRRKVRRVYYGLDPDTFLPKWNPVSRGWIKPKAHENLRRLFVAFDEVFVLRYPEAFDGDIGGKGNRRPHPRRVIEGLVAGATRFCGVID